jgi:hypothetical protein
LQIGETKRAAWIKDELEALMLLLSDIRDDSAWTKYGENLAALIQSADEKLNRSPVARALLLQGLRLASLGRKPAAREAWVRALALLEPSQQSLDPMDKVALAALYLQTSQREKALEIANDLKVLDFAHPEFVRLMLRM